MKKIKILVTAIAIISAGVAAIPQIVKAVTPPPPTEYYWFLTNDAGTALVDPTGIDDDEAPSEAGPCDGSSSNVCAKGLTENQTTISGGRRIPNVALSTVSTLVNKDN